MTHKTFRIKKLGIEKKLLCKAVIGALSLLPLTIQAQTDFFADTPFPFQKKNLITTAYSIKPNILLYIDNSGSMTENTLYECSYKTKIQKVNKNGSISIVWSAYHPDKITVSSIGSPNAKLSPDGERKYGLCHSLKVTKDKILRPILRDIVKEYRNNMYFALVPMNNSSGTTNSKYLQFYDTENDTVYNYFLDLIKNYPVGGTTPMHRVYVSLARNLVMNKLRFRCQKSYIVALTDGEADKDSSSVAESDANLDNYFYQNHSKSELVDYFTASKTYLENAPKALAFFSNTLSSKNFGPYIYTSDVYRSGGKSLTDASINHKLVKRDVDEANQPWNGYIEDPDHPDVPDDQKATFTQTAETFTIGFGLGLKNSKKGIVAIPYLEKAATPEGEYDKVKNPKGRFYNANDEVEIINAFKNIFEDIKGSIKEERINITESAPVLGVSTTSSENLITTVITSTNDWNSTICIKNLQQINEDQSKKDKDKATCNVPTFGKRKLILNDGKNTYLYADSELSTNSEKSLDNETFKIKDNEDKNKKEWLDGLLSWLGRSKNGKDINNSNEGFVLKYRERTANNKMGDILSNNISYIGKDKNSSFQKYMVTSANDGMVYVFKSTDNNDNPYELKFNYMPMGIDRQSNDGSDLVEHYYKDFVQEGYGTGSAQPHRYLMNGQVYLRQTEDRGKDSPQLSFMLATMGQAGRGAFAINIGGKDLTSNTAVAADDIVSGDWYNKVPLFQTPSGEDNKFGYTIGKPAIGRLRVNKGDPDSVSVANHVRQVGFISNGYNYSDTLESDNSPQMSEESSLYIYDLLGIDVGTDGFQKTGDGKGTLIRKIVAPEGVGGLSSPTMIDTDGDGIINYVYAGDYGGNLFRFDLNSADPDNWKATKIFSSGQPITISPMVYPANANANTYNKSIIVFGTGSSIYQSDLNNHDQQSIYGIYDDLTKTGEDALVKNNDNDLLQQTLTINGNIGTLSNNTFDEKTKKGWYIKLQENGERVVTPVDGIFNTGIVYTESYKTTIDALPEDPCVKTSREQKITTTTGRIQLDARNGGALTADNPHAFVNSDGTVSGVIYSEGQLTKQIVAGDSKVNSVYGEGTDTSLTPPGEFRPPSCLREAPKLIENGPNGVTVTQIKGVVMCPVSINRLSWREIKTGYLN